jgi:hypothetical protein
VCPTRANALTSCIGGGCTSSCNVGFHDCSGACVDDTSPASCGNSCTPCSAPAHGQATCASGSCGIQCDPGYARKGSYCVVACETTGCTGFNYCDPKIHLCNTGCTHHSQCSSTQFCRADTHTCEATTALAGSDALCTTGFKAVGSCASSNLCANEHLPAGTTYAFEKPCPAGSTARGALQCGGSSYVCIVDN